MRAAQAGQHQHAQPDAQHPAAIDPTQVAQRRHQRQRNQLRQRHQQHQRRGLQGPITLDLGEETRRDDDHRGQHHQHPGQHDQGKRQVAQAKHLQFEERYWLRPFIEQEQHQQHRAATQQEGDQARLEPVQAIALQQADHQHADRREPQQQAAPVELLETLQAQRVLWQAVGHGGHRQQARPDDLPERPLPADILGPQRRQRRAQARAERGSERVAGQAIQLDVGRQEAQRHGHQHRRQRPTRQALDGAQQQQAFVVRREGAQDAQHSEQSDRAQGETAQGKRHRTPRREGHGRHGSGGVGGDQPGAFIKTDVQRTANIREGHLGDHLVETGHQHRQQHADQADDDARAKYRRGDGRGFGCGRKGGGSEGSHVQVTRD